ncbi:hypothetical protein V6N12_033623 [Hibiscus sabdariffa]|uniref:Uncharacterized protein n=1 Tax=Hibiscus sabdariffa TaxID=183260 RepID=A0ABR2BWC1_9ROSI
MTSLTHHLTGTEAEEARKVYDPKTKLNGEVVKAKHVADAVLFLASQDSECITIGTEAGEDWKVYDPETKLNGVVLKVKDAADSVLFLASQDAEVVTLTTPDLTWWGTAGF